jgi:hypothetical protein
VGRGVFRLPFLSSAARCADSSPLFNRNDNGQGQASIR